MVTSRFWFTAQQKAELWERWKQGQSISSISRALERRPKAVFSGSYLSMPALLRQQGVFTTEQLA